MSISVLCHPSSAARSLWVFWGPRGEPTPDPDRKGGFVGSFPICLLILRPRVGPFSGSIKAGRRSSYLLAITTERSKSCDDGLNTFRDEGRVFR